MTSESFCMCFPKGYEGMSGKFHPGASCLKQCGTGETAEVARKGKDAHKAYAEGEQEGMSLSDLLKMKAFLDANDDGYDDETLELLTAMVKMREGL